MWNSRSCLASWMKRWKVDLWEETKVERALVIMSRLETKTSPRVRAAVLRTWANAWCTKRRFQGRGNAYLVAAANGRVWTLLSTTRSALTWRNGVGDG